MSRPRKILQASVAADAPWRLLTVADSDQTIGSPEDAQGIIATSSETAGVWSMTCDQDGFLPRDTADEMGRWMFDLSLIGVNTNEATTGIAFRFTPTTWPASGSSLCVGFGMITADGTSAPQLDALAIGLEDDTGSDDLVGICRETAWSDTAAFSGRVSSVRGVWVPNGDLDFGGGNLGSFDCQPIRTTGGGTPFTFGTHRVGANGNTQIRDTKMFLGFGFRSAGGATGVAVAGTFEVRPVVMFPGWPEGT